jgi:hypothetical protein
MRLLLAAVCGFTVVPALAEETLLDTIPPAEVTHIQQSLPVVPNSSMVNSFANHSNAAASAVTVGSVAGNAVSGIGAAAVAPVVQPMITPGLVNSLTPIRIR